MSQPIGWPFAMTHQCEPTFLEQVVVQSITGAATDGILMLMVGFLKHSVDTDALRP